MAAPLKQTFTTDLSGLTKGNQQAQDLVRQGADAMSRAFASAGNAAEHLEGSFKKFTKTARGEQRLVGYWTRDLIEMSGAGKGAKEVLDALAGGAFALLSRNPVLAGVEVIRLGVTLWKEWGESGSEATKKAKEGMEALTKSTDTAREAAEKLRFTMAGGTEREFGVDKAAKSQATKLDELNKKIAQAEKEQSRGSFYNSFTQKWETDTRVLENLGKMYEERSKILESIRQARESAAELDRLEGKTKDPYSYLPPEVRVEQSGGMTKDMQEVVQANKKKGEAAAKAFWVEYWKVEAIIGKQHAQQNDQGTAFRNNAQLTGEQKAQLAQFRGMGGMTGEGSYTEVLVQQFKEEQDQIEASKARWNAWGDLVSRNLGAAIVSQRTWGDAFKGIFAEMASSGLKWALSTIMQQAGVVGAEVMAQNAALGPWGWITGLGQAAAAQAATLAFGAGLGSAEAGEVLPSGPGPFLGGYLRINHADEMTLPADVAVPLRRSLRSGGVGGGITVHYAPTVHAMDERGVRDFLQEHMRTLVDELNRYGRYN